VVHTGSVKIYPAWLAIYSSFDSDGGSAHEMTSASLSPGFASSASFLSWFYSHQFSVLSMTCDFEERHANIFDEYDAYEALALCVSEEIRLNKGRATC
jgi:hypothetical protein